MRNYIFLLLLVALATVSCGKPDAVRPDTSRPEPDRLAMAFADPIELFPGDANNPSVDADVGGILNGPGTGGDIGTPWEDDNALHWAVAVALQRAPAPVLSCQVLYTFLAEGGVVVLEPQPVSAIDPVTIRLPKVAACYIEDVPMPYEPFVEVAVTYQWRGPAGDWEIGVVRMGFDPTPPEPFEFPQPPLWVTPLETIVDTANDNIQPDIAYDPNTGFLYLMTVVDDGAGDADLYFIRGTRSLDFPDDPTVVTWENARFAQDPDDLTLNSFSPRIDVGLIGFLNYAEQWMVALAYTAHSSVNYGWHVRLNYWSLEIDDPENPNTYTDNDFGWNDAPPFADFPAGQPTIDIGPPGSNHGAIAWMQAKTDEWSNSTVMYADSHDDSISYTRLHPNAAWGATCSAFPSVAVHEYTGDGIDDPYRASVSFLFTNDYVTSIWTPAHVWFDSIPELSVVLPGPVTFYLWTQCLGEWDSGAIIDHNYGMNTALTVYNRNYWMLWSGFEPDPAVWAGGPTSVWGAWGNTD